jgi:hypothetical protein
VLVSVFEEASSLYLSDIYRMFDVTVVVLVVDDAVVVVGIVVFDKILVRIVWGCTFSWHVDYH